MLPLNTASKRKGDNMGIPELIVIVLVVVWIAIPGILQGLYPNRMWVGMILSLFFGTAHFYLSGGLKYFLITVAVYVFLKTLFNSMAINANFAFPVATLFQAGLMYWRFLKLRGPQKLPSQTR